MVRKTRLRKGDVICGVMDYRLKNGKVITKKMAIKNRIHGGKRIMARYRVAYTYTKCEEEWIDANSFEEAKEKWEDEGYDAELFFIEDESGDQVIYD